MESLGVKGAATDLGWREVRGVLNLALRVCGYTL